MLIVLEGESSWLEWSSRGHAQSQCAHISRDQDSLSCRLGVVFYVALQADK